MKNKDPYGLRKISLEELCIWIAGYNEITSGGKAMHFLGKCELHRRMENPNALRSWIAIFISVIALIAALVTLSLKISDLRNQTRNINQTHPSDITQGGRIK